MTVYRSGFIFGVLLIKVILFNKEKIELQFFQNNRWESSNLSLH